MLAVTRSLQFIALQVTSDQWLLATLHFFASGEKFQCNVFPFFCTKG